MEIQEEIIQQTFNLTMKYGIKSVSMDDIARQLGMSKKTIYQHFANKKELVGSMVTKTIEKDAADVTAISESSKDAVDEMVNIASHVLQFLRGMSPTVTYDMKKYFVKQWQLVEDHHHNFICVVIRKNIERGITEGYYKSTLNADIVAKLYTAMCHTITDEDAFPLKTYSKSELYENLVSYHMRGIVTDKGLKYLEKLNIE